MLCLSNTGNNLTFDKVRKIKTLATKNFSENIHQNI